MSDITERRRAEEEAQCLSQWLLRTQRISKVGGWAIKVKTGEVWVSPEARRIYGTSDDEPISVPHIQSFPLARFRPQLDLALRELVAGRQPYEVEFQISRGTDGAVVDIHSLAEYNADEATVLGVIEDITDRKRSEAALRASEERFRGIFENLQDVFYEVTLDGLILDVSPSIEQISRGRYQRRDVIGKFLFDFYARPGEREVFLETLQRQGSVTDYEIAFKNLDGSTVPCSISAKIQSDPQGRPVKIIGSLRDITDRKRAEDALRESEERFRSIIENAAAGYFFIDREGYFRTVNATWLRLHKYDSAEEIVGKHFSTTQVEMDQSRAHETVERLLAGEETAQGEFARRCKDGSIAWHTFSVNPVRQGGKVIGVEGFLIDTTERKRAERNYRMLFREMLDGFALHEIICDEQGNPIDYRFLAVNPAFERMTGLKGEELVGRTVLAVLPGIERSWIETYGKVALTGEPASFENYAADLKRHFMVTAFRPAPKQFACVFVDLTERKRAEEEKARLEAQFQQAQKMESVGQLAGGVAHDFNNILAAIMMHLSLLRQNPTLDGETRESLNELMLEAQRAASLTRQLLMFSRRSILEVKALDLNEVVANLLKMLGRLIGEHIRLQFDRHEGLPPVEADPGMLEQVLLNLAVNARDAMPKGGRLLLRTGRADVDAAHAQRNPEARAGSFVVLAVADNGCGMGEETLKRIFEPFFTTKGVGKGTGLGLATVDGIVKQHGGWVEVQSQVGSGTVFRVYLPFAKQASEAPIGEEAQSPPPGGSESILFVEDEPSVRRTTASFLRNLGYTVWEAGNGLEASRLWQQHRDRIRLLFTDMVMPEGMTGLDLAEELRAQKPGLPVIISSGYSVELLGPRGQTTAGITYLPKPCDPEALARKVRECLEQAPDTALGAG